jgi:hypothetical protein
MAQEDIEPFRLCAEVQNSPTPEKKIDPSEMGLLT